MTEQQWPASAHRDFLRQRLIRAYLVARDTLRAMPAST